MINVVRGKLVGLSAAGGITKSRYRNYPYGEFLTDDGQRLRVLNFKAFGEVDRDLKEDTVGVYVFTKVVGLTNLVAVKTAISERVTPSEHEFGISWGSLLLMTVILSAFLFTLIFVPIVLLLYVPAAMAASREKPILHTKLLENGITPRAKGKTF